MNLEGSEDDPRAVRRVQRCIQRAAVLILPWPHRSRYAFSEDPQAYSCVHSCWNSGGYIE